MPAVGRKPSGQPTRDRNKTRLGWTDVENKPFEDAPALPRRPRGRWSIWTLRWWQTVSTMPHCVLWDESDWQFAFDTALIAAQFHAGKVTQAVELRQREKIMGTTFDARRDLRIRYVEPIVEREKPSLVAIEGYRKEIGG